MQLPVFDFHIHSFYSDGVLIPSEIVRRVIVNGHKAIAITDHADLSNIDWLIENQRKIAIEINQSGLDFRLLVGVELTHIPPARINTAAKYAKDQGAEIVVVHGETIVEPVSPGTNQAAIESESVDILAHPGILTPEQVVLGKERDLFFELSARKGHCLGNGLVARLCQQFDAKMLVNSDAHIPSDFLIRSHAEKIVLGTGLEKKWIPRILEQNPQELLLMKNK